ncbi:hypothetical protein VCHC55B2_3203B, partial [Vibrio cholerae HC-55B2]
RVNGGGFSHFAASKWREYSSSD